MSKMTAELIISLIDHVTAPSRAVNAAVDRLTAAQRRNATAMNAARGQMMDAVAVAYVMARALGRPIAAASEFQSAMADIAKVAGFDDAGLDKFGKQLRDLSTDEIPMAVTELAALAAGGAQGGVADADLLGFTEIAAKVAVAWDMAGEQTGDSLAHIKTALQLTVPELGLFADAINYLSNETASSAPQLVDYAERVAAQGEFYGYAKEETLAFGTAMISAGADSNVAATSFRAMGRALTRGGSATTAQRKAMKRMGLDSKKVAARMQKDAVGTTLDVLNRIGELPKEIQAATMTDIFGDEARALAPLLGNLDELQRVLGLVNDEKNYFGSAQAEFEKRSKTFDNSVARLNAQLNDLAISIGAALLPPLTDLMDTIGPVIMAISQWATDNPELVKNIVFTSTALLGLNIALIATRYAFLFLKGGVIDAALVMTRFAGGLLFVLNPLNLVKSAVTALRLALLFSGIGIALAAIAIAGTWIYNNWSGLVAFFQGFADGMTAALGPVMPVIQPIVDAGQALLGWVSGLVGPVGASEAQWRAWGETLGTNVGGAINATIEGIKGLINWVGAIPGQAQTIIFNFMTGTVDPLIAWLREAYNNGMSIAASISTAMVDPFIRWLWDIANNGLKIAVDIGKSIGDAANAAVGAVTGGKPAATGGGGGWGGTRATGGSVSASIPYLVGELGPELFTPATSGTIYTAARTARMFSGMAPGTGRFANGNAANGNAPVGPASVSFGDIIVQGGANASAEDVARAVGRVVLARLSSAYADGGY